MALPVAAIVSIVLGCWVILVLGIFALYQFLKGRGTCNCECAPCGKEGTPACECCVSLSESCNCCNPSLNGCLNSVCPANKKISCVDIILCQCCSGPGEQPCCVKIFPCCDSDCDCCDCDCCSGDCCSCKPCSNCHVITCCCLEIRLASKSESETPTTQSQNKYSEKTVDEKADTGKTEANILLTTTIPSSVKPLTIPSRPKTTARSISQVDLLSSTDSYKKSANLQTTKSSSDTKSKPETKAQSSNEKQMASKVKRERTHSDSGSLPSLTELPSREVSAGGFKLGKTMGKSSSVNILNRSPAKHRQKVASELVEVSVARQDIPIHSHLYYSKVMPANSWGSSGTISLGDSQSSQGHMYSNEMQMSANQVWPHGSVIDGSTTQRSMFSYRENFGMEQPLTSSRPLPVPAGPQGHV